MGIHLMPPLYEQVISGPPQTFTALASILDANGGPTNLPTYSEAYNATNVTESSAGPLLFVYQNHYWSGNWDMSRAILVFDTLLLKPAWTVTRAYIHWHQEGMYSGLSTKFNFSNCNSVTIPIAGHLYEEMRDLKTLVAQEDVTPATEHTWRTTQIYTGQLDVIRHGQYTVIGIREIHEYNADPSQPGFAQTIGTQCAAAESVNPPYLEIHAVGT